MAVKRQDDLGEWKKLAQEAEARVTELEQACAFLQGEAEARARQLEVQSRVLREQRQRLEAQQRALADLRHRLEAAQGYSGRRLLARLASVLHVPATMRGVVRACFCWI